MLVRYPGGKGKLAKQIVRAISGYFKRNSNPNVEYREPFFGAGAIGLRLLESVDVPKAWFNDFDTAIYALWHTVVCEPDALLAKVDAYEPSVSDFYNIKDELKILEGGKPPEKHFLLYIAFKKLVIHQISYSGLGTKSGGPLGGDDQKSDYKVDCRWSPKQIRKEVKRLHKLLNGCIVRITNKDFAKLITDAGPCFLYLDPPYYVKGPELYQFSFTEQDHTRLANQLAETPNPWLLSYDDCQRIRELYEFAEIKEVPLNYTINGATTKTELLIAPKQHAYLLEEVGKSKGEFDMFEEENE